MLNKTRRCLTYSTGAGTWSDLHHTAKWEHRGCLHPPWNKWVPASALEWSIFQWLLWVLLRFGLNSPLFHALSKRNQPHTTFMQSGEIRNHLSAQILKVRWKRLEMHWPHFALMWKFYSEQNVSFCLHLFTTAERKEEQNKSSASTRGELSCTCTVTMSLRWNTSHICTGFQQGPHLCCLSSQFAELGAAAQLEVTWFSLQWHRCCQFSVWQE